MPQFYPNFSCPPPSTSYEYPDLREAASATDIDHPSARVELGKDFADLPPTARPVLVAGVENVDAFDGQRAADVRLPAERDHIARHRVDGEDGEANSGLGALTSFEGGL